MQNKTNLQKIVLSMALLLLGQQVSAEPQWAWDAGKQTNNGAIIVKSVSGGTTYSGTQNPTGSAVKMNQIASTQPPTVVIVAQTGLSCYEITTQAYTPANPYEKWTLSKKFPVMGFANPTFTEITIAGTGDTTISYSYSSYPNQTSPSMPISGLKTAEPNPTANTRYPASSRLHTYNGSGYNSTVEIYLRAIEPCFSSS